MIIMHMETIEEQNNHNSLVMANEAIGQLQENQEFTIQINSYNNPDKASQKKNESSANTLSQSSFSNPSMHFTPENKTLSSSSAPLGPENKTIEPAFLPPDILAELNSLPPSIQNLYRKISSNI